MREIKHKQLHCVLGKDGNIYFFASFDMELWRWQKLSGYMFVIDHVAWIVTLEGIPQKNDVAKVLVETYENRKHNGLISTYRLD